MARGIEEDSRGIISPAEMARHVRLTRVDPPTELAGLVHWFWCVRWDLPEGVVHRQQVLPQPGVNVSVGDPPPEGAHPPPGPWPLRVVVNGVSTGMTTRVLSGAGFTLAAKTTTGGFGAWVNDVATLTDRVRPGRDVVPPLAGVEHDVARRVAEGDVEAAAAVLAEALFTALDGRPAERVRNARQVAALASRAEQDRSVRRLGDLAGAAGVSPRTLQRLFTSYVGASPTWVIRRFRLLEAAELVRHGEQVDWAEVAADLGYADQAHLVRDFTANIGLSPAAYARAQRSSATLSGTSRA